MQLAKLQRMRLCAIVISEKRNSAPLFEKTLPEEKRLLVLHMCHAD
jgi:hypothetical protein